MKVLHLTAVSLAVLAVASTSAAYAASLPSPSI